MSSEEFWRQLYERAAKLDQLSYYDILTVDCGASDERIRRAFYNLASFVHPDRHARQKDSERKYALTLVYAALREAFSVLSNQEKRALYDRALASGKLRLEETAQKPRPRTAITNPRARRFFELGQERLRSGARESARQQFQFALQMEPDSQVIKRALHELDGCSSGCDCSASDATASPVKARQFERTEFPRPVEVQCATWSQFATLYARDLSQGGMLVRSTSPAEIDERVRVSLTAPDGRKLVLDAAVTRAFPDSDDRRITNLGLRFAPLSEAAQHALRSLIEDARKNAPPRERRATPPPIPPKASSAVAGPTTSRPGGGAESNADLGRLALSEGRYREACDKLKLAVAEDPRSAALRAALHLARAYIAKQEGRLDEARLEFEWVLVCDPLSEEAICELRATAQATASDKDMELP